MAACSLIVQTVLLAGFGYGLWQGISTRLETGVYLRLLVFVEKGGGGSAAPIEESVPLYRRGAQPYPVREPVAIEAVHGFERVEDPFGGMEPVGDSVQDGWGDTLRGLGLYLAASRDQAIGSFLRAGPVWRAGGPEFSSRMIIYPPALIFSGFILPLQPQ